MENYREFLESKIAEAIELEMPISKDAYQDALDAYLSFQDADKLKNESVTVVGSRSGIGRPARFGEVLGTVGADVHFIVGNKNMHDTLDRIFLDTVSLSKNAPIQGRYARVFETELGMRVLHIDDQFEKQRGITIRESIVQDNSFEITAMPRMTEPLIPLDKYGKPLGHVKSKYHR